eukprot:162152-Pyramimonas_sp.AAC.1
MARHFDPSSSAVGFLGGRLASVILWSTPLSPSDVHAIANNATFDFYETHALLALYYLEEPIKDTASTEVITSVTDISKQQANGKYIGIKQPVVCRFQHGHLQLVTHNHAHLVVPAS